MGGRCSRLPGERTIRANDFALLWPNHERRPSAHKHPTESCPYRNDPVKDAPRIDPDGVLSQPGEAELYGTSASTTASRARAAEGGRDTGSGERRVRGRPGGAEEV